MKLYYYFSVNDRFFTDATIKLAEKYPQMKFYGLAGGRRDFIEEKNFYDNVSYLSELDNGVAVDYEYLLYVERKYNIRLSDLINSERTFWRMDKINRLKYAEAIIRRIEKDFENYNFTVIFAEGIDDFPSYFLQEFAKYHQIPFYYFVYSRLGGSVFLSNRKDTGPINLESLFKSNCALYYEDPTSFAKTKDFISNYIKNKSQPYYVTQSQMLYKTFSLDDVKVFIKAIKHFLKDSKAYHAFENPLYFPVRRLQKIRRKKQYSSYFKNKLISWETLKNERYMVYPLHFHPEAATLIQGRWFNNQKEIIEMISKVLPVDMKLIVKEHKVSIGRRPINFYKEIDELFNVYFVSENQDVYSLLQESSGVVTISSSMGLEAIMLNKPVITFGDIHYNILSQVIKVRDFSTMREYVDEVLSFKCYEEAEYWSFFKTITENCYEMPGYSPHVYTDEHVNTFILMIEDIRRGLK